MEKARIVRQPAAGQAQQLFLLFCDAACPWQSMATMAGRLGEAFPAAAVVIVTGPLAAGEGGRWLMLPDGAERSGADVAAWRLLDEGALAQAVGQALPGFIRCVRDWQSRLQVAPAATALLGQGEGATLALAAALSPGEPAVCGRVSAVGGRYATVQGPVPATLLVHLLHGKLDQAVHYGGMLRTAEQLVRLDADLAADVVPHEGAVLSDVLQDWIMKRLQTQVPRHLWQAAMQQADQPGPA